MKINLHFVVEWVYRFLSLLNDLLLIPMFILIVQEVQHGEVSWLSLNVQDLMLSGLFFSEWVLGLYLSTDKKVYVTTPLKLVDLVSCLPFATLSQSVRLARLSRVIKVFRLLARMKQYTGVGAELLRVMSVFCATVFTGGYCLYIIEPNHPSVDSIWDAVWWSLVTVSTVGYGDVVPETAAGRLIAAPLIMVGIGVGGYVAGFMSQFLASDSQTQENQQLIEIERHLTEISGQISSLLEQQTILGNRETDD